MDPLVLNTAFNIVSCLTNGNRHFPFLSNTVSYWPRQEASLPCFSDITLSWPQELFGFYYISGLLYSRWCIWWNPVARCVNVVEKTHTGQWQLPTAWSGPLPRYPTVSGTGTELFSQLREWVIWPVSTFCPGPFLTNHTHCMLSGRGP